MEPIEVPNTTVRFEKLATSCSYRLLKDLSKAIASTALLNEYSKGDNYEPSKDIGQMNGK